MNGIVGATPAGDIVYHIRQSVSGSIRESTKESTSLIGLLGKVVRKGFEHLRGELAVLNCKRLHFTSIGA